MTAKTARASVPRILLTAREAATACGVSRDRLIEAVHAGDLRAKRSRNGSGLYLFRPADLEAWADSLEDA